MNHSAVEAWDCVLEQMGRRLDELESAIESGDPLPSIDFTPPGRLPALPPEFAARATALSERNQEVLAAVSSIIAEHPVPVNRVRPDSDSGRPRRDARFDFSA